MDLKAVYDLCRIPMDCGSAPDWEGRVIEFSGYLDPNNVYFQASHPQLPYEKFSVIDNLGRSIEVWPHGSDNNRLFTELISRPKDLLIITGRLKSFKMPVGDNCTYGFKVVIDDIDQVQFVAK